MRARTYGKGVEPEAEVVGLVEPTVELLDGREEGAVGPGRLAGGQKGGSPRFIIAVAAVSK
jgi:hypothetical protein